MLKVDYGGYLLVMVQSERAKSDIYLFGKYYIYMYIYDDNKKAVSWTKMAFLLKSS